MYSLALSLLAFNEEILKSRTAVYIEIKPYTLDPKRNLEAWGQQWNKLGSSHK